MRLTFPQLRQLRLAAKLTVPFVVIFISAIGVLGTVSIRSSRTALTQSLGKRAEILVRTLATTLADPFAMGEVDRLQQLLDEARKTDSDVSYTILLNTEGKAVASTDDTLKNQTIMRNDFEKAMAQVTSLVQCPVPGAGALFEVATPVRFEKNLIGVLRIGVSTQQVDSLLRHTTWSIVSVGALALLVGFSIYLYVACLITRPLSKVLRKVVDSVQQMAEGDLRVTIESDAKDEVGQVAGAMRRMAESLRETVAQVNASATKTVTVSQQLTVTATQLASGAQEQTSSLEETTAALEQLTHTVRQNADYAKQACELATGSRDLAEKGGQVVVTAVAAMDEINTSARRIADIIGVIDGIAFQTNLLALNAAVEAARAGAQGRGFAVVAAEVRNLAQRSATAAQEIKRLIQDSVQKARSGSELVHRSGQALEEIVGSIQRVTNLIAEMAAAGQAQSAGIAQVNKAMTQMDQVTQANAAQTEGLTATAHTLATQAEYLQTLVGRFKLSTTDVVDGPTFGRLGEQRHGSSHPTEERVRGRGQERAEWPLTRVALGNGLAH